MVIMHYTLQSSWQLKKEDLLWLIILIVWCIHPHAAQLLRLKSFVGSLHTRYGLEAGGAILEHMVPEPRSRAHDIQPNVLFIEYLAWVCVTAASTSPYSMWLQPPQMLTRRLIPSSVLDVVLGALLTAADLNNKFHPIKVEKVHVSGNFYLVGTFLWALTIF